MVCTYSLRLFHCTQPLMYFVFSFLTLLMASFVFAQVSEQSEVTLPTTASHMTISPSPHPTHTPHPHPSTSQEYTPSALPSRASTRIDWYQPSEGWSVRRGEVVGVEFLGHSLTASSAFGCVLVDQVRAQNTATIPEHLKVEERTYVCMHCGVCKASDICTVSCTI